MSFLPISFIFRLGLEGECPWEMVGVIGGKGPSARPVGGTSYSEPDISVTLQESECWLWRPVLRPGGQCAEGGALQMVGIKERNLPG